MLLSEDDRAGDIFRLKLGNLNGNSSAKLTFAYAVELDVELQGVVRFILPTVLCPRYTPGKVSPDETKFDVLKNINQTELRPTLSL